jgi:hypothetical protein
MLYHYCLSTAIKNKPLWRLKKYQEELKLKGINPLLIFAKGVSLLGKNINTANHPPMRIFTKRIQLYAWK